jgi:beta-ureidopropionase
MPRNREVRVVAIAQDGLDYNASDIVNRTFERLDRSASFAPDLVCLPECFPSHNPEPLDGPTVTRVSAWAREHRCWAVCPILVKESRGVFNSSILIDRTGKVAGRYDKIHPTTGEIKDAILPGATEPPVFDTDFGRLGLQICFDVNWPRTWSRLKEKGAELIVWASAFPGRRRIEVLAHSLQTYIVAPVRSRPTRIFDITGETIAESGMYKPWAEAVLHLDKRIFEIDYQLDKIHALERKYAGKARVNWYHDDDAFTLESLDPERSVADLIREFELTPLREYLAQSEAAQNAARPRA